MWGLHSGLAVNPHVQAESSFCGDDGRGSVRDRRDCVSLAGISGAHTPTIVTLVFCAAN